ncbi:MAG: FliM/FliN family flagellar motor switch protein [Pseudomonadota bacterium]
MAKIDAIDLDLKVVIGFTRMTVGKIMGLTRGSVIRLDDAQSRAFEDAAHDHRLQLTVNDHQVGSGCVRLRGADVLVEVTG